MTTAVTGQESVPPRAILIKDPRLLVVAHAALSSALLLSADIGSLAAAPAQRRRSCSRDSWGHATASSGMAAPARNAVVDQPAPTDDRGRHEGNRIDPRHRNGDFQGCDYACSGELERECARGAG